ncbi:putative pentatricopeptide repeat protein [Botrytis fragariae]|uniref:Putative pentatricopeptide repeat protein n=1 Tax=Botrytis fragariae TaxID=1964551 RepID=A0A8H6EF35_9HELO|nr:putative pentatricopeptide repeat protein [Botrytis fragariae]KAF5869851.1 putative pentatricopeptide repeat protein [Botrytis fragariae]
MPPFSNSLPRRWSPSELPILPFLAPRVFQPWPSKSARVYLKTKTGRNQGHDGHARSTVGRGEDTYSKCLGGSSPNVLVQPSTRYAKFSKRRTTPTSFARIDIPDHRSIRRFSSKGSLGRTTESNGDGSPTEDHSKAPYESGSNGPSECQLSPAASTSQDSGKTEDSMNISSSLRPRRVRSTASSFYRPGIHLDTHSVPSRPGALHSRSRTIPNKIHLYNQDVYTSCNFKPSRSGDPTALPLHKLSKIMPQQPSSTSHLSPQIKILPEKSSNETNSSDQPVAIAATTKSTRTHHRSTRDRSERQDPPATGSRLKNNLPRRSLFFRRPSGYKFLRENHRRSKGILSVNRNISLNRRRLHSERITIDAGLRQELLAHNELWAQQQGLPELSTKYLRVKMDAGANIMKLKTWKWSSQFAIINQRHEDALRGFPKLEYNNVAVSKFPLASRLLFIKQDNVAALAAIWRRVPTEIRSHVWEELMLTAMDQYPASILKLLLATYQAPCFPPGWAANDCLDFAVSHYFGSQEHKPTPESFTAEDLRQIFETVQYLQLRGLRLSARSIYLLQLMMNDQEFKTFYLILTRTRQHLTGKTLLRFAYRFARSRQTDMAFQVLQQATQQGIDLNLERWPQICNVLLTGRYRDYDAHVTDTELFDFMLHHGLKPGIVTYNILIQNSLQAGDHLTAWQIYDMMIENRVMADAYTYSIMLNDAKIRGDDVAVEKLAHWMSEDSVRNSYTVTDILDTIFRLHRREYFKRAPSERRSLQTPFSQMLPIYLKNFEVEPLAQIIPRFHENFLGLGSTSPEDGVDDTRPDIQGRVEEDQHHLDLSVTNQPETAISPLESAAEDALLEPNYVTLIVMLKSYIGSVRNYKALLRFYNHFKALIAARDPIVAPLLVKAQIYNHLLVGLGHLDAPMHDCLKIVADMQAPHSKPRNSVIESEIGQSLDEDDVAVVSSSPEQSDIDFESDDASSDVTDDTFQPPPPSLHTWTTLLNVFMQRHQPRAAEKVLQIMIEKEGLEPNQATWNALTMGYMRLQDPQMTADALIRTKRAGFTVDHIMASRWWLRFQARARLSEALQSASGGNETSLADVANAMESESEMSHPAEDDIIDEEVLEATTSRTGDIYRILKRRLQAVNSPVYPNWIFDAMIRAGEENVIEPGTEPISDEVAEFQMNTSIVDDVAESELVSAQSSDKSISVNEQNPRQLLDSQIDDQTEQRQRQSVIEDKRESRLLPTNKLLFQRTKQWIMTPGVKAFRRSSQERELLQGVNHVDGYDKNDKDRQS